MHLTHDVSAPAGWILSWLASLLVIEALGRIDQTGSIVDDRLGPGRPGRLDQPGRTDE